MKSGQFGFYAQDKWNVTNNFELTYGIRFDIPVIFNDPTTNVSFNEFATQQGWEARVGEMPGAKVLVSPRVGFRWYLNENHRTLLRGGLGLFTGRVPFVWLNNSFTNNGMEQKGTTLNEKYVAVPGMKDYAKNPYEAVSGKPIVDIAVVDKDFKYPQVFRTNLASPLPSYFCFRIINYILSMKKTFAYALLVLTALYSCEEGKQEEPVLPETTPDEIYLNVSPHTLTFDETDASKNIITVSTNTNWKATVDNSELKINRTEGTSEDTSISITEAPEGKTCKLTISTIPANGEKTISKEVSISRAAAVVTPDRTIIYNNDFDKETAVKNTYWPYLDQFDGWKNANGTGSGAETYDQMSVSVRSDWTSDYAPPSDYRPYASGKNNIYFNKAGSFVSINNINIAQEKDFILQFGSSENKTFDYDDLKVEIGNGASWVEIDYSRNPTNSWALTTSMFSLQNSSGTLSIRLTATGTTQMRIDDIRLTDGEPSEQIIVFDNTVYPLAELPAYENDDYVVTHYGTLGSHRVRNYTMLFDKEKHAALWVAYPLHSCYRGNSGRTEAWAADPLIEMLYQAKVYGETFCYYKNYSRGHQIPSADRTATDELNSQTFYASNMTPQNGDFNGGIWASLEGKIRENMCQDTLYVVTGCYFGNGYTTTYDGYYGNNADPASKICPVPTHYFKVVLRTRSGNSGKAVGQCGSDELKAIGFWLEHRNDYPQTFSTEYCKSVEYIEQQTGFTFFPSVPKEVKKQCTPSDWVL